LLDNPGELALGGQWRWWGLGGALTYKKDGVLVRNFETNSLRGTMILFCGGVA